MASRSLRLVLGTAALAAGCDGGAPAPTAPQPQIRLLVASGADQIDTVGRDLALPVTVVLRDEETDFRQGGARIWIGFETGGGSVRSSCCVASGDGAAIGTTTDGRGEAAFSVTLGLAAGSQILQAWTDFPVVGDSTLRIALFAEAGPVARVVKSGDGQVGAAGEALPLEVGVIVSDAYGNPQPQVTVTWSLSGEGAVSPTSGETNATGWAGTRWTLGQSPGVQQLWATVAGAGSFGFTATAN